MIQVKPDNTQRRAALLIMAGRYRAAAAAIERGNEFANTLPTQRISGLAGFSSKLLILFGERGGNSTRR
ncbi:hypothetical protein AAFG13_04285 [Bradyrhizobium sp. B124]|uniref:hypothetical protein n=1 Tax=Bradyrhizobium sp. B124 TaxID=3140245 RepID=UPI003182D206